MTVPTQIDHVELGLDRLPHQFEDSDKIKGLIISFLEQSDTLEELLFQLLNDRGIFTAVGVQLDVIGALFGVPRLGRVDEQYRAEILRTISGLKSDGTTEIFMQVLRNTVNSTFVDFFEHPSGDVHALLGEGFTVSTYTFLKDLVAAGVNFRAYADLRFDSFAGSELISITSDLQTNLGEDIQVTPDNLIFYDLQVQRNDFSQFDDGATSILPEIVDVKETPYLAELLFRDVKTLTGDLVDENDDVIFDDNDNALIWVEYEY